MSKCFIPIIYLTFYFSVCLFVCVKEICFHEMNGKKEDSRNKKWKSRQK